MDPKNNPNLLDRLDDIALNSPSPKYLEEASKVFEQEWRDHRRPGVQVLALTLRWASQHVPDQPLLIALAEEVLSEEADEDADGEGADAEADDEDARRRRAPLGPPIPSESVTHPTHRRAAAPREPQVPDIPPISTLTPAVELALARRGSDDPLRHLVRREGPKNSEIERGRPEGPTGPRPLLNILNY